MHCYNLVVRRVGERLDFAGVGEAKRHGDRRRTRCGANAVAEALGRDAHSAIAAHGTNLKRQWRVNRSSRFALTFSLTLS